MRALFLALLALPASAQDIPSLAPVIGAPHGLVTAEDAAGWEAVGRIDLDGRGFCTGALIAPTLVLTAAHCLYDRTTGDRFDPATMHFLAGWRGGRAVADRGVRRAVAHPDYVYEPALGANGSATDLALLELVQPIRSTQVVPFETGDGLLGGSEVSVVSYAADRADLPSREDVCSLIGQDRGVYVLTCSVNFGSSGAPIFQVEDGVTRIVSVVSAMGELDGERVSLGASLGPSLDALRAALAGAGEGLRALPTVRAVGAGERADTGARFVQVVPAEPDAADP